MANLPAGPEIERMAQLLARLPGLGPRSARRASLALLKQREALLRPLGEALIAAADSVATCSVCGNIDSTDPCSICADPKRDRGVLCVVEDPGDIWALERAGAHKGRYHVLGGVLSAIDGIGPDQLNIAKLIERASAEETREVILAMNATVDGQSTAHYLMDALSGSGVAVSRLAHGVPVGGELGFLDDGTLAAAMKSRRTV
ncbi:MAG: recombination mediator RecR [Pseudomonadota bacterium]